MGLHEGGSRAPAAEEEKQALFGDPIVVRLGEAIADLVERRIGAEPSEDAFVAEVEAFASTADARLEPFLQMHPPPCTVRHYVNRITKYSGLSEEALVCTAAIVNRVCANDLLRVARFEEAKDAVTMHLAHYNAHRIVLASALLAAKFNDEMHCSNAHWAKVGGVTTDEINDIERSFLRLVNHRLLVEKPYFKACEKSIWLLSKRVSVNGAPRSIACSPILVSSLLDPSSACTSREASDSSSGSETSFDDVNFEAVEACQPRRSRRGRLSDVQLSSLRQSMESIAIDRGEAAEDGASPRIYDLHSHDDYQTHTMYGTNDGICSRIVGVLSHMCDKVLPPVQKLAFGVIDAAVGGKADGGAHGLSHPAPIQTV